MRIAYTRSWKIEGDLRIEKRAVWICPQDRQPKLERPNDCEWIVPETEKDDD